MPQSFHVVRCYKCQTFQVDIVKKSNKWQCKVCGDKQSIKKVFSTGTGSECRSAVQQLNLQIGLAAQLADQSALDDFDRCPAGNDDNHPYEQSFADDPGCLHSQPERMHPRDQPEQPQASRWDAFLPQQPATQIQFEPQEMSPPRNNSPDPPRIASVKRPISPDPPTMASVKRPISPDPPTMASVKRPNRPDPQTPAAFKRPVNSWNSSPQVSNLNPIKQFKTDPHPNLNSANVQRKSSFPTETKSSFIKQTKSSFPNQTKSSFPNQTKSIQPYPDRSVAIPTSSTIQPPKSFATDFVKRYFHPLQNKPIPSKSPSQATVSKPTSPFSGNISTGPSSTTETSNKYSDQNQVPSPATSTATTASSSRWSKFLPTAQDCE